MNCSAYNKRINLTVASVTPLALVPSAIGPALGEQQAARRPAASAADATAGYARRYTTRGRCDSR